MATLHYTSRYYCTYGVVPARLRCIRPVPLLVHGMSVRRGAGRPFPRPAEPQKKTSDGTKPGPRRYARRFKPSLPLLQPARRPGWSTPPSGKKTGCQLPCTSSSAHRRAVCAWDAYVHVTTCQLVQRAAPCAGRRVFAPQRRHASPADGAMRGARALVSCKSMICACCVYMPRAAPASAGYLLCSPAAPTAGYLQVLDGETTRVPASPVHARHPALYGMIHAT